MISAAYRPRRSRPERDLVAPRGRWALCGARKGAGRSGVTYEVTEEGRRVTDDYGAVRRRLLIQAVAGLPGFAERLSEATRTLNLLSGIYEEIARVAATHRRA